jgi:hypothetical protein
MLGRDVHDESRAGEQDNKTQDDERGGEADAMWQVKNEAEDRIKIDKQDQAMLDLLQPRQDEGTPSSSLTNLLPF